MATLVGMEWVDGRLHKTWAHIGEDGRKKLTIETVQDVEPAMEHAKAMAQNANPKSFLRFKANVTGTHIEDACRIACKQWGISFQECFREVMQGKSDCAKSVWRTLTEGRDFAKLQARHYK